MMMMMVMMVVVVVVVVMMIVTYIACSVLRRLSRIPTTKIYYYVAGECSTHV